MTLNNTQKLLAGALALVLVAGMTSPAFAGGIDGCVIEPVQANLEFSQKDGSAFVDKKITCAEPLDEVSVDSETCSNYDVFILNPVTEDNMITFTEQVTNVGPLESEECTVKFRITTPNAGESTRVQGLSINVINVAGQLLPLDSSALLIGGLSSMSVWMIPAVAGIVGAGIYLVKYRARD